MEKGEEFESKAFETMEKDFQEVLAELSGNDNLDYFRHEYEKLHRALKKSHGTSQFPHTRTLATFTVFDSSIV